MVQVRRTMLAAAVAFALAVAGFGAMAPQRALADVGALAAGAVADQAAGKAAVATAAAKPAKAKVSSVKSPAAGKVTVKVKAVKGAKGYQYKVGLNKAVSKGVKKKTTTGKSCTFKGLKQGKKYYAKVRAYKTVNGKKVWGAWSAAKAVTVKKAGSSVTTKNSPMVGKWEWHSSSSPNGYKVTHADVLKLRKQGSFTTLTLNADGKAYYYFTRSGNVEKYTWKAKSKSTGTMKGMPLTLKDGKLTLKGGKATYVFERAK